MPTFVVYHISSTRTIKLFDTAAAAKRSCTCSNRNAGNVVYGWSEYTAYEIDILHKTLVKHCITGELVEIDSNTPNICDLESEICFHCNRNI